MTNRFKFLDLLKAYAVVMMVQGHTLSAVLAADAKATVLYQFLHVLRGLTAPAFLLASGCGLAFSLIKKSDLKWWEVLIQRFKRVIPILIIGYFLHLPRFSLYQLLTQTPQEEIIAMFQCDILQTIGWTIIAFQILLLLIRPGVLAIGFSLVSVILILYFTPMVNHYITEPNFFTQLLTPFYGSNFPLFPFSAYLISGWLFGSIFYKASLKIVLHRLIMLVTISGGVLFGSSFLIPHSEFTLFYFRTGALLILISLFLYLEKKSHKLLDFFVLIGQESLLIYVAHLMLVYGSVINDGFIHYWRESLNTFASAVLTLSLIILMLSLAYLWHRLKERNPQVCKILSYIFVALISAKFLTKF